MLRSIVKIQIIDEILHPLSRDERLGTRRNHVLMVDKMAMSIVNSCLTLPEAQDNGVILIEDLSKNREPMPSLDAIYIMTASPESVDALINDFSRKSKFAPQNSYRSGHVFFLEPCDDVLFKKIANSPAVKYIKTLKEVDMNFRPVESQIFTIPPSPNMIKLADGIASMCLSMKINPVLRFHSDFSQSAEICYRIDSQLKEKEASGSCDADLIVIDRSFDLISPLLHETTLQSMAVDLTDFVDGIYRFDGEDGQTKQVPLDEGDPIWMELRHKHLAEVLTSVQKLTKELKEIHEKIVSKTGQKPSSSKQTKELSDAIKNLPGFNQKKAKAEVYLNLVEELRDRYFKTLEKIILLEQDMAVEHTPDGTRLTDAQAVSRLSTFILPGIQTETRLRLILIFLLSIGKEKDEQFFHRLLHHTNLPEENAQLVYKMLQWRNKTHSSSFQRRRPPPEEERFPSSRWDPKIRNLIQEIQQRRLDEKEFKIVGQRSKPENRTAMSARYGGGLSGRPREKRKIIIFIVGGVTYSEIKTAYEMSEKTNTTVILGSDQILTPSQFLENLRSRP